MSPTPVTLFKNTKVGVITPLEDQEVDCILEREGVSLEVNLTAGENQKELTGAKKDVQEVLLKNTNMDDLKANEINDFKQLLNNFDDVFSKGPHDLGRTNTIYHKINTEDQASIRQAPRRLRGHRRQEVEKMLDDMVDQGVIQKSFSPRAAPVVLVKKKDALLCGLQKAE